MYRLLYYREDVVAKWIAFRFTDPAVPGSHLSFL